jgi:hypothetical protein
MRQQLWQVDRVVVDLEDRDATVALLHRISLCEITVRFRLKPEQLDDAAASLRRRIELLAGELILDLGSFLDSPAGLTRL